MATESDGAGAGHGSDVTPSARLRQDFDAIEGTNSWPQVYSKLRSNALKQESDLKLTTKHSKIHARRNRYRDVLPYDQWRVTLLDATPSRDYINASLVPVEEARRKYILTQGPLQDTSGHFWQMVWEQGSMAIIMLNRIIEKDTLKCHQYFPDNDGESLVFDKYQVTFVGCERKPNYCIRTLKLHRTGSADVGGTIVEQPTRILTHYQFTTWPDFGVPLHPEHFLEFLYEVRKSGFLDSQKYGPAVVHCSAGIGRSGTFVIVDSVLVMSQEVGATIDVLNLVLRLRKYRMGLIQTFDQLRFSWLAAITALETEKWKDLVGLTGCTTPIAERKASYVKRVNANTRIDDVRGVSVDNSELDQASAPKKPKVTSLDPFSVSPIHQAHSARDTTATQANGEVPAAVRYVKSSPDKAKEKPAKNGGNPSSNKPDSDSNASV